MSTSLTLDLNIVFLIHRNFSTKNELILPISPCNDDTEGNIIHDRDLCNTNSLCHSHFPQVYTLYKSHVVTLPKVNIL